MDRQGPVLIWPPDRDAAVPVVFDSPHSGREYPRGFAPAVPVERLIGYEDRYVDDLLLDAPEHGVTLLAAAFPRAYIDPNRAVDDLDRDVVGDDWADPLNPTVYSERGIGLVFRTSLEGKPIYERPLTHADLRARIDDCWRPFHATLDRVLDAAQARWGAVWHVNWHSMRPVGDALSPDPGEKRPDFVVSDRDGTSAEPAFTDDVVATLRGMGYSVAINEPFKGGYIVERHGRPGDGRHSLQIEINRKLYLDLETLEVTPASQALRRNIAALADRVAAYARRRSAA